MPSTSKWLMALCTVVSSMGVKAQVATLDQEYGRYMTSERAAAEDSSFGEHVDLRSGALSFDHTDLELPGTGPTIRISRRFRVTPRVGAIADTSGNRMGEWELALPRLKTLASARMAGISTSSPRGWQVGAASNNRCTEMDMPGPIDPIKAEPIEPDIWWAGYQLVEDDGDEEELLANQSQVQPGHVAVTKNHWIISCLPSTANGLAGEAFLATAPDGTRYWLDYLVYRNAPSIGPAGSGSLARSYASMLVTKAHRFGNWVKYNYNNGIVVRIEASDGRSVDFINDGVNITTLSLESQGGKRTWQYRYEGNSLVEAVRPDGSSWRYSLNGLFNVGMPAGDNGAPVQGSGNCMGNLSGDGLGGAVKSGTITSPGGAVAVYSVRTLHIGRSYVPKICFSPGGNGTLYAEIPKDSWTFAISEKNVSGPGMVPGSWAYAYSGGNSSWDADCQQGCASTVWTDLTDPAGTRTRYIFSNRFDSSENLLQHSYQYPAAANAPIQSKDFTYALSPPNAANYPFGDVGAAFSPRVNLLSVQRWTPVESLVTTQDGATFRYVANTFDSRARATTMQKASSLRYSKVDGIEYHDDTDKWVIGQAKRRYNLDTGYTAERNEFDPGTALPVRHYEFEKLKNAQTYHDDGTLATRADGLGNTTTYANWKRGIPQVITYADGSSITASVDDNGMVRALTDENGYTTTYGYDAMGRLASVIYPNEENLAYAARTIEFRPLTVNDWFPPGYHAGQWRRYDATGNHVTATYYDGMLRPTLVHDYDASNVGPTLNSRRYAYDLLGRRIFESYPSSELVPGSDGVADQYDALDRNTQRSESSELGSLLTRIEYLDGFQVRTTNPRGYQTTRGYEAYDVPVYDLLAWSSEPEGKRTQIARNKFGLPESIKQGNAAGTVSATRFLAYDQHMDLCKRLEPETGATVLDYDNAGNIAWTAAGLRGGNYDTPGDCGSSRTNAANAGNRVNRTYDARNRLTGVWFPDGKGSQSWAYYPDGLVKSSIVDNDGPSQASVDQAYQYNKRRLLVGESMTQRGWYTWSAGYGYDANGSLASTRYPNGLTVSYMPNALGQASQVVNVAGKVYVSGALYHPDGALKSFTYGNGIVHSMQQNVRLLPARITDGNGANDLVYSYDADANVTKINDWARDGVGSGDAPHVRYMTYDGLDRLLSSGSCMYGGDCWHRFTYDALDNLRAWTLAGMKDYSSYVYDGNNRLVQIKDSAGNIQVSMSYLDNGNVQSKNSQTYQFDLGNRLKAVVNQESYRYDAQGRRVLQWSPYGNILSMYGRNGQLLYTEDARRGQSVIYLYLMGREVSRVKY